MKAFWLLAPVLLSAMAVGQDAANDRAGQTAPHLGIPTPDDPAAQRALNSALREWREAYRRAQASERPEELVEVGDLYRRIGEDTGVPAPFEARAREIYTSALSLARRQESLDGIFRVAEAFAALGDRQAVERALAIARSLTARDPEATADVRAFAARIAAEVADESTHPGR